MEKSISWKRSILCFRYVPYCLVSNSNIPVIVVLLSWHFSGGGIFIGNSNHVFKSCFSKINEMFLSSHFPLSHPVMHECCSVQHASQQGLRLTLLTSFYKNQPGRDNKDIFLIQILFTVIWWADILNYITKIMPGWGD